MIFFDDWISILRVGVTAPVVYVAVVLFIRLFGKRSTSQMNNFDWIVTVAAGSIVGSVVLLKDVAIIEGLEAIVLLLGLQYLVTKLSVTVPGFSQIIRSSPKLLFFQGNFLEKAMKDERVTHSEILSAMREAGHDNQEGVAAVVLESDAKLSVIPRKGEESLKILRDVSKPPTMG
jgi:uncharacterized membrane protein YcaP (DUF421 family)